MKKCEIFHSESNLFENNSEIDFEKKNVQNGNLISSYNKAESKEVSEKENLHHDDTVICEQIMKL